MKISAFLLALSFVTVSAASAESQSTSILTSSTEGATRGAKMTSVPIVDAVLDVDKDLAVRLRECMSENHIEKNTANKLFVSVLLPAINQNQQIYFVRGSLDTACPLIGAHAFYYWLVVKSKTLNSTTYDVRYSGASDTVSVLRSVHHGMYDLEASYFTATNGYTTKMQFDGSKYIGTRCTEAHRTRRGKEVVRIVPCSTS